MTEKPAFKIDLTDLKTRKQSSDPQELTKVDEVGEAHGFLDRTAKKRRGRPPSPRTGQVHAKVLPGYAEEISAEAKRRGVQQGVLIEEAWQLYREKKGL